LFGFTRPLSSINGGFPWSISNLFRTRHPYGRFSTRFFPFLFHSRFSIKTIKWLVVEQTILLLEFSRHPHRTSWIGNIDVFHNLA
jgi:hypothetical protein